MEAKGRRRIFVAGATGYLGRFVVREALARGYAVRALTRDGARLPPELAEIPRGGEGAAFEVAEGEATRPETLRGLTRDCDVLFSSLGITRQRDKGVKYADVDYGANRDRSGVVIAKRNQFSNRMANNEFSRYDHIHDNKIGTSLKRRNTLGRCVASSTRTYCTPRSCCTST